MGSDAYRDKPFSEPVRQMVAGASDEQLAWMVGPDRRFYSEEALEAAAGELERRREASVEEPPDKFNALALVFGPLWYMYNGMVGRGVLLGLFETTAIFGLYPLAETLGIPPLAWTFVVYILVGGYCGRFAERDLRESQAQRRFATKQSGHLTKRRRRRDPVKANFVLAANVGCRMAGEQAKALLKAEGIEAIVKCEDTGIFGPGSGIATRSIVPAQVLVPESNLEEARDLLKVLLAELDDDPQAGCHEES